MSQSAAEPVGARTARPCDSCLRKRARWYCPADDAFLCQACDNSVHSANQLARRHERVKLKTSSSSALKIRIPDVLDPSVPSWHRRKARTPRYHKKCSGDCEVQGRTLWSVVPDLEAAMAADEGVEEEEQLIQYRVPILDPVLSDFRSPPGSSEEGCVGVEGVKSSAVAAVAAVASVDGISGFLPSEMDMAEFAMDVERLFGQGPHPNSFSIDDLGLSGPRDGDGGGDLRCVPAMTSVEITGSIRRCKKEATNDDENFLFAKVEMDPDDDTFHLDISCGEEVIDRKPNRLMLKLNYESVINEWSTTQGSSPWSDGKRLPNLNPDDDGWQDYMETILGGGQAMVTGLKQHIPGASIPVDIGREARVSRYREKRRTRLFSKKIRYEVRKLNAEKRPRMKGRFVKTPSFASDNTNAIAPPQFVF